MTYKRPYALRTIEVNEDFTVSCEEGVAHSRDTSGTSKQGMLYHAFEDFVMVFGNHNAQPSECSEVCWVIETPAGIATIYDWKQGVAPEKCIEWTIGAKNQQVVEYVHRAFHNFFEREGNQNEGSIR